MRKRVSAVFAVCLILLLLSGMTAVGAVSDAKDGTGTIHYELNGGAFRSAAPDSFLCGATQSIPLPVPEKAGCTFGGWYRSADFSGEPCTVLTVSAEQTEDIRLYARFFTTVLDRDLNELQASAEPISAQVYQREKFMGAFAEGSNSKVGNVYFLSNPNDTEDRYIRFEHLNNSTANFRWTFSGLSGKFEDNTCVTFSFGVATEEGKTTPRLEPNFINSGVYQVPFRIENGEITATGIRYPLSASFSYVQFTYDMQTGACRLAVNGEVLGTWTDSKMVGALSEIQLRFLQNTVAGGDSSVICMDDLTLVNGDCAYPVTLLSYEGCTNEQVLTPYAKTYGPLYTTATLPVPVWEGHRFEGWYTDDSFADGPVTSVQLDCSSVTVYAKWNVRRIFYQLNGYGSLPQSGYDTEYIPGETQMITLPDLSQPVNGSLFMGWYAEPDFSSDAYTVYDVRNREQDLTFYAKWSNYFVADMTAEKPFPDHWIDATTESARTGIVFVVQQDGSGILAQLEDGCTDGQMAAMNLSSKRAGGLFTVEMTLAAVEGMTVPSFYVDVRPGDSMLLAVNQDTGAISIGSVRTDYVLSTEPLRIVLMADLGNASVTAHVNGDFAGIYPMEIKDSTTADTMNTLRLRFPRIDGGRAGQLLIKEFSYVEGHERIQVDNGTVSKKPYLNLKDGQMTKTVWPENATYLLDGYWMTDSGIANGSVPADGRTYTRIRCVELLDGASVRLDDPTGLRFETSVDREMLEQLRRFGTVTVGTLVIPTDLIGEREFTIAGVGEEALNFETTLENASADGDSYTFYASVVNLLDQNYTRKFSAVSYVKIVTEDRTAVVYTAYEEARNARSVYEVAYAAYAEGGYSPEQTAVIRSFIDRVVVLDRDLEIANNSASYDSPFTVSYEDGILTITDAADVAVVLIDGVSYTRGFTIVDDVLTAPYISQQGTADSSTES